jgi:hypothetical protein
VQAHYEIRYAKGWVQPNRRRFDSLLAFSEEIVGRKSELMISDRAKIFRYFGVQALLAKQAKPALQH